MLPFCVWQIRDAMVAYLKGKDVMRFVAAAGVLAHYIGGAFQPLHCSYLHHGIPPMTSIDDLNHICRPEPKFVPSLSLAPMAEW